MGSAFKWIMRQVRRQDQALVLGRRGIALECSDARFEARGGGAPVGRVEDHRNVVSPACVKSWPALCRSPRAERAARALWDAGWASSCAARVRDSRRAVAR